MLESLHAPVEFPEGESNEGDKIEPPRASRKELNDAVFLSKKWVEESARESARETAQFYNDLKFNEGPATSEEIARARAYWTRELLITEGDVLLAEKLELVRSGYKVSEKKHLLSILKHLELEERLPLSVKKEAANLVVPYPVAFPELILACKKLIYEFSSRECDDEIFRYLFHRVWDYQEELSTVNDNEGMNPILGEKLYMSEGLLWETERSLEEALDFEDREHYAQVGALLEFLKKMMDLGIARTQFTTLQDVIRMKVNENTGTLLKMRAEEILNASDLAYRTEKETYFRYGKQGIGLMRSDGLYVASFLGQDDLVTIEQLELCEEHRRIANQERLSTEHEKDFLSHILEGEDYGPDAVIRVESELEIQKNEAKKIGNQMLRNRYLIDIAAYFKKRKKFAKKSRFELAKEQEVKNRRSHELWLQCEKLDKDYQSLVERIRARDFKKIITSDVVQKPGVDDRAELAQEFLDYKYLLSPAMRRKLTALFSFPINLLSPAEQFQFLTFIKTQKDEKMKKVSSFARSYGETGLRTFLSLEYGREIGDKIVALGEKLPKEEALKLFQKYGELVDAATEAETSVRAHFPEANLSPELLSAVRESLLRRGRDLLASFATTVTTRKGASRAPTAASLERELGLIRGDAALFVGAFKELSERGENFNLAEIKDVEFHQGISPEEFSPADKERMRELYRINYGQYPEFQKMLLEGFEKVLNATGSQFYVLRYKGVIEGFYRLGVTPEDTLYFGAFNMNPKYAGSGLGEALMRQSLDVRAKDSVIEATCTATLPIAANYIERGFVGTGAERVKEIFSMNIIRHDTRKNLFRSKELTAEDVIRTCEAGEGFTCVKVPLRSLGPEHFSLLSERGPDGSRFVLTRYIRDKKTAYTYLVFEKTDERTIQEFSSPEKPLLLEKE